MCYADKQKGFTLFELMIVMVIISLISGFGYKTYDSIMFSGKMETMDAQAKIVLHEAEILRLSVDTQSVGGNGEIIRTYKTLPAPRKVSTLSTARGVTIPVPDLGPFGFNYTISVGVNRSFLDGWAPGNVEHQYADALYFSALSRTRIRYFSLPGFKQNPFSSQVKMLQKSMFLENVRY